MSVTSAICLPGLLDRVEVGHVGHGAAGVEVGKDHLLVGRGQDVGGLGHEVDPAEDHELGVAGAAASRDSPNESPRASAQRITSSR